MRYAIKRTAAFAVLIAAICFIVGCSQAQQVPTRAGTAQSAGKKILIVYLSRTKNTKAVAEIVRDNVGGTLVELELERPYPADYRATVDQVAKENETNFLPPLKTKIEKMNQYDVVFVGFPTWGMQLPPPMKSFLHKYDLKGKTIIPFNTNAGYGVGTGFATVKALCPDSNVLEGFTTTGGIERDGVLLAIQGLKVAEVKSQITAWLRKIKILHD
jgi:flavodoxin